MYVFHNLAFELPLDLGLETSQDQNQDPNTSCQDQDLCKLDLSALETPRSWS